MNNPDAAERITPIELRNYRDGDYHPAIKENLVEGELYDAVWDSQERIERRTTQSPDSIVIAALGDRVAGSVFLADELFPYIFRLAVRAEFRGKGIREQLMDEAVERLRCHGHKEGAILVDESNPDLIAWYEKRGFKRGGAYRSLWKEI